MLVGSIKLDEVIEDNIQFRQLMQSKIDMIICIYHVLYVQCLFLGLKLCD
jgi:hypothetical protein